jgi:hypothetical protein
MTRIAFSGNDIIFSPPLECGEQASREVSGGGFATGR